MKHKTAALFGLFFCTFPWSGLDAHGEELTKADVIESLVKTDSTNAAPLLEGFARTNETAAGRVLRRASDCVRLARRFYENYNYPKAVMLVDGCFAELNSTTTNGIVLNQEQKLRSASLRFYAYHRILHDNANALVAATECVLLAPNEAYWQAKVQELTGTSSSSALYSALTPAINAAHSGSTVAGKFDIRLLDGRGCRILYTHKVGGRFRIEKSHDLITWSPVYISTDGEQQVNFDDGDANASSSFYRVTVEQWLEAK